ncbi:MAG: peptidoglycan-binding protein [Chthoniobacteraceae bacterium]
MKLQKVPVLAAAFLMAIVSPQAWAFGPGGHGGGGHGGGPGGFHGGGGRGGGFRCGPGPGCGGGRFGPGWGGGRWNRGGWGGGGWSGGGWSGGYGGGYGYPYMGYGGYGNVGTPNYVVNYSPYITTGVTAVPTETVDAGVVAEAPASTTASGDLVGNVQRALRARGFYRGPIDGISGLATRAAIRAYAGSTGLAATGIIDRQLLASLGLL